MPKFVSLMSLRLNKKLCLAKLRNRDKMLPRLKKSLTLSWLVPLLLPPKLQLKLKLPLMNSQFVSPKLILHLQLLILSLKKSKVKLIFLQPKQLMLQLKEVLLKQQDLIPSKPELTSLQFLYSQLKIKLRVLKE